MAEINKKLAKKMAEILLEKYNTEHHSNFSWNEEESYQPKNKPYADFIAYDGKKELPIQHTFAVADEQREFVRPKNAENVMKPLIKKLENNPSVPSIHISINFHNPPKKKEEVNQAVFWLDFVISEKIKQYSWGRPAIFRYNADFDEEYVKKITKWIDDLDILPVKTPKGKKDVSWGFSWDDRKLSPWPNDVQRVLNAVYRKKNMQKDIILMVEVGLPSNDVYVEKMKESLKDQDLPEIWIVEPFYQAEKAFRIR